MKQRGGSGPVSGPLEIGPGAIRWQLVSIVCSSLGVLRLAGRHDHIVALVGMSLMGLILAAVLLMVVRQLRLRSLGPLLRIDEAGIALFDGRTVRWTEIREVREVGKGTGLAFLPAGPAELPVLAPALFMASPEGVARRRTERYGTPLVVFPAALDTSKEEISAAVRRFGVPLTGPDGEAATA
ncbi:hypothetical protein [Streptomyces sp. NPDC049040]|uniref:hypothetical protein n=1 Tax=Streptomyces sp. NPDC049040 TaxID=3365593 RepID=UPI003723EBC4